QRANGSHGTAEKDGHDLRSPNDSGSQRTPHRVATRSTKARFYRGNPSVGLRGGYAGDFLDHASTARNSPRPGILSERQQENVIAVLEFCNGADVRGPHVSSGPPGS